MARILAFDYGTKRIGVAETDDQQIIASPVDTIEISKIFDFISTYLSKHKLDAFVVGMPMNLSGKPTDATQATLDFIQKLKKKYPALPVYEIDERFTSQMAFQAMIDGGLKKKKRRDKSIIDKVSAAIILQSYLEQKGKN